MTEEMLAVPPDALANIPIGTAMFGTMFPPEIVASVTVMDVCGDDVGVTIPNVHVTVVGKVRVPGCASEVVTI
jgi:hypothetical protein